MAKNLTEDAVRDLARDTLGLADSDAARAGVGQLTTFNQLGFPGVMDKPDGWYLPKNKAGWKDLRSGKHYKGGQYVTTPVDKARIPVFVRVGTEKYLNQ